MFIKELLAHNKSKTKSTPVPMTPPLSHTKTELDEPILFRTTSLPVYESTLSTGSIWLRTAEYYKELEDKVRADESEGINSGTTAIPLHIKAQEGFDFHIAGRGQIGQIIVPHYILSLHGTSIAPSQRNAFGGHTMGIRSLFELSTDVLCQASKQVKCSGYRYGAVYYQHCALAMSLNSAGAAAIHIGGNPGLFLNPIDTDVLRKRPIEPFTLQDEWRIVIFVRGYLNDDPSVPLKINVAPDHFYPYLGPDVPRDVVA